MADLKLTLRARGYDRLLPLRTGDVKPEGIELTFLAGMPADLLTRISNGGDADLGECSMGQYSLRRSRGVDDVVALPIFPLRMFRQGDVFVRRGDGLNDMSQLKGKRIGLEGYGKSSNIWTRGIMQHEYGVSLTEIAWFEGNADARGNARLTPPGDVPPGINLQAIGEGQTLAGLLLAGELDAVIPSYAPEGYGPDGLIDRLYPDYAAQDRRYYQQTGLWPIQHTIVIRRSLVDERPWVVGSLVAAFERSTEYWKGLVSEHYTLFPWGHQAQQEAEQLFGDDFYRHGLVGNNRRNVEVFLEYAYEQGLVARRVTFEELFAPGG